MRPKLAAFSIERRRISVAIFSDDHLDYTGSRQLPSIFVRARDSVSRYIDWIKNNFEIEAAAIEMNRRDPQTATSRFAGQIITQFRDSGIPIIEVKKELLFASFGHPPLKSRTELRAVVSSIWPILASKGNPTGYLDAAALGLYVRVEKMFAA